MEKDFEVTVLKPGQEIELSDVVGQVRPIGLYVFPKGDLRDQPSYCWVLVTSEGSKVLAQISHRMLMDGLMAASDVIDLNGIKQ